MLLSDLPDSHRPVIIAAKRTPIGRVSGGLEKVELEDLVAPLIGALVAETGLAPETIDDVILGNATGGGGNIARLAALQAGLPVEVAGVSIDRQCGSGLEAVMLACNLIAAGAGGVYLAGGVESSSRAPIRMRRPTVEGASPEAYQRARFAPDFIGDPDMGVAAENVAAQYSITRTRQDAFALQSHQRAVASQANGTFVAEIVPIAGHLERDECPRPDTSLEKLAGLKPVFDAQGTVTAGNACPLNDGAAVVVVTSLKNARACNVTQALEFAGGASAGVDPNVLGIGPVSSTQKLLQHAPDLAPANAKLIEFNEAFASQVLASLDALEIRSDAVNLGGGALALGHPFGASGAILVTRLLHQFRAMGSDARDGDLALAMMGIGGGMGLTAAFRHKAL